MQLVAVVLFRFPSLTAELLLQSLEPLLRDLMLVLRVALAPRGWVL